MAARLRQAWVMMLHHLPDQISHRQAKRFQIEWRQASQQRERDRLFLSI